MTAHDKSTKALALYLLVVGRFWPSEVALQLNIPLRTVQQWRFDYEHANAQKALDAKRSWKRLQCPYGLKLNGKVIQLFPPQNH